MMILEMMKRTSMLSMNIVAFVAVGCLLLLSTPANGFSFRTTVTAPGQNSWFSSSSSNTADRATRCPEDTNLLSGIDSSRKISIAENESSTSRRSILRGALTTSVVATALFASVLVSNPSAASAGIDVSGLRVQGTPKPIPSGSTISDDGIITLAGVKYTPAAMILQMAEQTASMEGMIKASASDVQGRKTKQERIEAGSQGTGPGVVSRGDLTQSVGVMIRNSKIATIAPKAAMTLQGIPDYLSHSSAATDMTFEEYLTVAKKYEDAREDLRIAFEKMSPEEQQEGKQIARAIRQKDEERMAAFQQQQ